MEIFAAFGGGLFQLLSPSILLALLGGTLFGWIFGILPGLGPLNAMAIAWPLTFFGGGHLVAWSSSAPFCSSIGAGIPGRRFS
jgi:TctA family transporter